MSEVPKMPNARHIHTLLLSVVRQLVDEHEAVRIEEIERPDGLELRVLVSPADLDRILGPEGRTIRSLRAVADAAGLKQKQQFFVEVVSYSSQLSDVEAVSRV